MILAAMVVFLYLSHSGGLYLIMLKMAVVCCPFSMLIINGHNPMGYFSNDFKSALCH